MAASRMLRPWFQALVAGLALGALAWAGDEVDVETAWRLVAFLANLAAPWVVVAFLLGRSAGSPRLGAIAGGVACVTGVAAYYLLHLATGTRVSVGARGALLWVVVGVVVGPLMGWCGGLVSSRPDRPPLLAVAMPGGALLAEALWLVYSTGTWRLTRFGWIDVTVISALVVLAVGLTRRMAGDLGRALPVFGLVVALALGGAAAFALIRLA